mmetsp:Transcript_21687/g.38757  ORF Transcript_21687/g.38757 Transcript_21687/m.38757 type:complete len:87 (+) Transcript_21687:404-664(+)
MLKYPRHHGPKSAKYQVHGKPVDTGNFVQKNTLGVNDVSPKLCCNAGNDMHPKLLLCYPKRKQSVQSCDNSQLMSKKFPESFGARI